MGERTRFNIRVIAATQRVHKRRSQPLHSAALDQPQQQPGPVVRTRQRSCESVHEAGHEYVVAAGDEQVEPERA